MPTETIFVILSIFQRKKNESEYQRFNKDGKTLTGNKERQRVMIYGNDLGRPGKEMLPKDQSDKREQIPQLHNG